MTGVSGQTITGIVADANGSGIPAAQVSIHNSNSPTASTQTDTEGRFSITGNITARTRLTVSATGFTPFERELAPNGVYDFTIVLQPAAVSEDVTVSITREETTVDETPASVVALTRRDLDATAAQTVDDTLRQVAGFTLFRAGSSKTTNPTTQGANLRGVSGSGASRASVLFDGLSLNDAFGGWTYWSRVPRVAVQQAEVLRGGASAIYGSGGLSGAVNLVPVRAEDGETIIRLEGSGGSQETADVGAFVAHARNKWTVDLAANAFTTGGYIPVAEDERGSVDTRATSQNGNVIAGIGRMFSAGRLFARGSIFSEDRDNGTSLTENATYFRQIAAGGDLDGKSFGRFEVRTFLQTQVYDQTFSAVSLDRNSENLTRLQRVPSQAYGGNLFWSRALGDHAVASSFEFRDVRGFSDELGFTSSVATSASGAGGHQRELAVFAQDFWRITDGVNLSVGGRYDYWENFDAHAATRIFASNGFTSVSFPDRSESSFSPRIGVLFDGTDRISFYGSYSRSFRAPTLNELYRGFRVGNAVTLANENLRAENANTFEGGVRFSGERFSVRANAFVTTVTDPVVSITLSSTPSLITRQRQNVGETRSRGVEIDADYFPIAGLKLSASYLFVDARVTEFPGNESLVGNRLPQVPEQQLNIQFQYRPDTRWTFGSQTRISSERFEDDANTLQLGSYTTTDVTVAFRANEFIEIFGAVENIFNSRYDIALTPTRSVAAPAFVRVGLRYSFSKR